MRRLARISPLLLLLLLLASPLLLLRLLRPVRLLNRWVPRHGLDIRRGLAYGPLPRQRLDLYRSRGARGPLPLLLFLYGGGWDKGRREDYLFAAEGLARAGHLVLVPDYRLYPEVRFPAFLQDTARAVAWARGQAADLGADPGRLCLMGHSAGAYNAAFVALDPQWLAAEGLTPAALSAVVGLAGPYGFDPLADAGTRPIFDSGPAVEEMQPVNFAAAGQAAGAPPFLLLHGAADRTVQPRNGDLLAQRLRAAGGAVEQDCYAGLGHVGIVLALAHGCRRIAPVLPRVLAFLDRAEAADGGS